MVFMCVFFALALAVEDISAFVDVLNERFILDSFCVLICFCAFFVSPSSRSPSSPFHLSRGKKKAPPALFPAKTILKSSLDSAGLLK